MPHDKEDRSDEIRTDRQSLLPYSFCHVIASDDRAWRTNIEDFVFSFEILKREKRDDIDDVILMNELPQPLLCHRHERDHGRDQPMDEILFELARKSSLEPESNAHIPASRACDSCGSYDKELRVSTLLLCPSICRLQMLFSDPLFLRIEIVRLPERLAFLEEMID